MHQHSSLLINGQWQDGDGPLLESRNPSDHSLIWQGHAASHHQIVTTVGVAQQALLHWREHTLRQRAFHLQQFLTQLRQQRILLEDTLAQETGQPLADARQELDAVIALIEQHLAALPDNGQDSLCHPCGVVVLINSFSQPLISSLRPLIPILLGGNTLICKPSEYTPRCAELLLHLWQRADLPDGVINLLQGGPEVALGLAQQEQVEGIYFTGQRCHALQLHQLLAGRPEVALHLHSSGNNPLFVDCQQEPEQWLDAIISSAFRCAGQRCSLARRLLISADASGDLLLARLLERVAELKQQLALDYMGTIADKRMAQRLLQQQAQLQQQGAELLIPLQPDRDNENLLCAAVADISQMATLPETELFGPLLQVIRVASVDTAAAIMNHQREQLADGVFCLDQPLSQQLLQQLNSPLLSHNQPMDQLLLQPDIDLWRMAGYSNSDFTRPATLLSA